jgi:hypothetical protein
MSLLSTASPTVSTETKQAAQAYVATAFVWDKTTFSVCFWQTDNPTLLQNIKDQADLWSEGTRIRFDFGIGGFRKCNDERSADIRVTVGSVPVNYYAVNDRPAIGWDFSEYGNLASKVAAKVSMSLVRVPRYLTLGDSLDFNFDVAHEFGHALGLIHEFQRIDCTQFLASKQTVMQVYGFKTDADYDLFVQNLKQISSSDTTLLPQELFNFNRDLDNVLQLPAEDMEY